MPSDVAVNKFLQSASPPSPASLESQPVVECYQRIARTSPYKKGRGNRHRDSRATVNRRDEQRCERLSVNPQWQGHYFDAISVIGSLILDARHRRQAPWPTPLFGISASIGAVIRLAAQLLLPKLNQQVRDGIIRNLIYRDFPLVSDQHLFRHDPLGAQNQPARQGDRVGGDAG